MIDKKQLIEELLECVKDATDTETQITGLSMCATLMNEVLDEALTIHSVVVPKGPFLYPYKHQLKSIDQLNQTQASLSQQLQILRHFANKLGLYDASDYLKEK